MWPMLGPCEAARTQLRQAAARLRRTGRSLAEEWAFPAAPGTVAAFERRLHAAAKHVGHLVRGQDVGRREEHRLDWRRRQLSVIDIHTLHDRAKRFVVGAVLKRMFEDKESLGTARPLVFVVLAVMALRKRARPPAPPLPQPAPPP